MSAPLNLINRFDLLITNSPASLPHVLAEFAEQNITPMSVNAVSHKSGALVVTVVVKHLNELRARALEARLKLVPAVKSARVEHMVS